MLFGNQDLNMDQNSTIVGDGNTVDQDMNIDVNIGNNGMMSSQGAEAFDMQRPIVEPMQERCVQRTIVHQVPHICPIRTRIINHHIFKHTYCPEYSCCEENVVSNIDQGSCCNFR